MRQIALALLLVTACSSPEHAESTPLPKPDRSPGSFQTTASQPLAVASPSVAGPRAAASPDVDVGPTRGFTDFERGGSRNVVSVFNDRDGRFRARGNAELDRIRGEEVSPSNIAEARSSCTDCQTIAVALQVSIYRRGASVIAPVNRALALNEDCTRCMTVARAIQYVIPVDDVRELPREVDQLVQRIDREARYFERIKDLDDVDPREAEARLNQLVADFGTLQAFLSDLIDRKQDSTPPSPVPSPKPPPRAPAASPSPRP